jgi:hypothetical protein
MLAFIAVSVSVISAQEPTLTAEQIEEFLLTADIVKARGAGKGVTGTSRLTLSNGTMTHDAHFQSIDVRKEVQQVEGGREFKFADSYHFNIAAYRLARLLGLGHMVPVTVERRWKNKPGALAWWVDAKWDEDARIKEGLRPPPGADFGDQLHQMYVFSQLVYDTDRNKGNLLYTANWKVWMVDFSRAFRPWSDLRKADQLVRCERGLFERLQTLTVDEVADAGGPHLTRSEIEALMKRRDLIVQHFQKLIAEKGEQRVLY